MKRARLTSVTHLDSLEFPASSERQRITPFGKEISKFARMMARQAKLRKRER